MDTNSAKFYSSSKAVEGPDVSVELAIVVSMTSLYALSPPGYDEWVLAKIRYNWAMVMAGLTQLAMTKILTISEAITTFRQVETKLGLTLTENHQFFTEWMDELPPLSELEQARLEQVR